MRARSSRFASISSYQRRRRAPRTCGRALAQAGNLPDEALAAAVADRRAAVAAQASAVRSQYELADRYLIEAERLVMEHLLARLDAELAWHDELLARLPKVAADFAARRADPGYPDVQEPA